MVVCDTKVEFWDYPIIRYAYSLGYKIVYDQVETDYNTKGTNNSIKTKIHFCLQERSVEGLINGVMVVL